MLHDDGTGLAAYAVCGPRTGVVQRGASSCDNASSVSLHQIAERKRGAGGMAAPVPSDSRKGLSFRSPGAGVWLRAPPGHVRRSPSDVSVPLPGIQLRAMIATSDAAARLPTVREPIVPSKASPFYKMQTLIAAFNRCPVACARFQANSFDWHSCSKPEFPTAPRLWRFRPLV